MSVTLYLLLATTDGGWQAVTSRSFSNDRECLRAAKYLDGRELTGGRKVIAAICKESIDV